MYRNFLRISILSTTMLACSMNIFAQSKCLELYTTGISSDGFIELEWQWLPPVPTDSYGFTLYQWDDVLSDWQTVSTNCDKPIQVLNVYPDIAGSDKLKTWMDDPAIGLGKIMVTLVTMTDFNANPNSYLKSGGEYIYDVIMFGSWDRNSDKDLNSASATAVRAFLDSGRGVLFGHDTQTSLKSIPGGQGHPNFISLGDKTNLDIDPYDDRSYIWRGSTNVKVINDGFLLKYPHLILYESILTIPHTHSTGQTAKGIVWMNFPNTLGSPYTAPPTIINGGTNDFYLTTWNNAAVIQTGHSKGESTLDERKVIANTLWYLAQLTTEKTAKICSALDLASPDTPTVKRHDCNLINIQSKDNGSLYRFYIKATNNANATDTCTSNTLDVINKTGLKGFYVLEDNKPVGVPNPSNPATKFIAAADNQLIAYTVQDITQYVHIQAIDFSGNLSEVVTLEPPEVYDFFVITTISNDENYGYTTGNGKYDGCSTIRVEAFANNCYRFANWTTMDGDTLSVDYIYEFQATEDMTLIANFFALDFDDYALMFWDNTFMLDLAKMERESFGLTNCIWYKNGNIEDDTRTINEFSYSAGPYSNHKLECDPTWYMFELITENYGNLCSTHKILKDCPPPNTSPPLVNLVIYPNPTQAGNSFTIENIIEGETVQIYNQYGICVSSIIATDDVITLTLNVSTGIYLIHCGERYGKVMVK